MSEKKDDSSNNGSDYPWTEHFEDFCSSDELSIREMRRMTDGISFSSLSSLCNSSFLHLVCLNDNVTLEIVEYLIDLFPVAIYIKKDISDAEVKSAYPLHLACYNEECPNEVIQLLLKRLNDSTDMSIDQLTYISHMDYDWGGTGIDIMDSDEYGGTPLHFYLSRTSSVNVDIVKQLSANPRALLAADEDTKCTPIHILLHNENIGKMFEVVKYLAETNPSSLQMKDEYSQTPLDLACKNRSVTAEIIEFLLEVCPSSVRQLNNCMGLPMHSLCDVKGMDDEVAIDILKLLLEAHPGSVSEIESDMELPLHQAATNKSRAFCRILVDAYPESIRRVDGASSLPLHNACGDGRPETVEYLFGLYPESLHIRNNGGYLPIHEAVNHPGDNTPKVIKFFLRHDPECLSKPVASEIGNNYDGYLPLHLICAYCWRTDESNVTEFLFDLYPEAILIQDERGQTPFDILRSRDDRLSINSDTGRPYDEKLRKRNRELLAFLSTQMGYAYKAQDQNALITPDRTGSLPLHNAVRSGAPLGSIKLLVKGYLNAVHSPDDSGMLPLDTACHSSTLGVVKYLAELVPGHLNRCNMNKNYPLHHACRGGNCEVIQYLLETPMSSASVSERNIDGMLPIHLFCEHLRFCHRYDLPEYTETIWRLLSAYPETVLNW